MIFSSNAPNAALHRPLTFVRLQVLTHDFSFKPAISLYPPRNCCPSKTLNLSLLGCSSRSRVGGHGGDELVVAGGRAATRVEGKQGGDLGRKGGCLVWRVGGALLDVHEDDGISIKSDGEGSLGLQACSRAPRASRGPEGGHLLIPGTHSITEDRMLSLVGEDRGDGQSRGLWSWPFADCGGGARKARDARPLAGCGGGQWRAANKRDGSDTFDLVFFFLLRVSHQFLDVPFE